MFRTELIRTENLQRVEIGLSLDRHNRAWLYCFPFRKRYVSIMLISGSQFCKWLDWRIYYRLGIILVLIGRDLEGTVIEFFQVVALDIN